jgi:hypothetical protein
MRPLLRLTSSGLDHHQVASSLIHKGLNDGYGKLYLRQAEMAIGKLESRGALN